MTDSQLPPAVADESLESLVGRVADEFLARRASGETPDPDEYAAQYPHAANVIRLTLAAMQIAGGSSQDGAMPVGAVTPMPEALGDYRIIREVGRGGMGVVYEAEQLSLRRRVALKVLPFAAVMDPRHLQRFHSEALAAAALDHAHVVKVYGVGQDRGVHFIAMQFVDGRSLADLICERRGETDTATRINSRDPIRTNVVDATPPATQLPTTLGSRTPLDLAYARRVAEWGIQAAEALEHAHSLGIVHRDIKPGNLIVDDRGSLFVADFGLARVGAADASVTATGDLLGTPRYMSPEQAAAKHNLVDHRSDVYSLGATLYELLTLAPAVGGSDRVDILRRIGDADPVPLSRMVRRVPRGLETVVLKCLAKDPAQRYQATRELADDLHRFLAGEPVRARRIGAWGRSRAWVRRRPALAALTAVAVASAVGLVALLLWHNERLRAEAERTAHERDTARKAQRSARRAVNDMYTQVAEQWLGDTPYLSEVQRQFLTKALAFYEDVAAAPGGEPEDRLELGRALSRIPGLWINHSDDDVIRYHEQAVRVLMELVTEYPGIAEYKLELVRAHNFVGHTLLNMDQFEASESALSKARTLAEALHRDDLDNPDYRQERATSDANLARLYLRSNRLSAASESTGRVCTDARWLVEHFPIQSRYSQLLARAEIQQSIICHEWGQIAEAEGGFRQGIERLRALIKQSPGRAILRHELSRGWEGLADLLLTESRVTEALTAVREAVGIRRCLNEEYPDYPPNWHGRGSTGGFLANVLARLGRFDEAEATLLETLPFQEKIASANGNKRRREERAVMDANLAWLRLRRHGAPGAARDILPRLARARVDAPPGERFRLSLQGLARYRIGELDAALALLRSASEPPVGCTWRTDDTWMRRMGEHQEEVAGAVTAFTLALTYQRLGRSAEALDCYRRGEGLVDAQTTPTGYRSIDVETLRAEAGVALGLLENGPTQRVVP